MKLWRVWCRYEPDYVNPLTGRRGRWRVIRCYSHAVLVSAGITQCIGIEGRFLAVTVSKPYPRGSIIRPHKELNRVFAARRASAPRLAKFGYSLELPDRRTWHSK